MEDEVERRLNIKHDFHGPLHIQALVGYYSDGFIDSDTPPREKKEMMQRMGLSPILSAQKILSHCYYRGLRPFIENDSLWE